MRTKFEQDFVLAVIVLAEPGRTNRGCVVARHTLHENAEIPLIPFPFRDTIPPTVR